MPDLEGMNYEMGHVPIDINTDTHCNWVSMKDYDVCHIKIKTGAMGASTTITVNKGTDLVETYTSTVAFDEYYIKADCSAYASEDATPSGIFTRVTGAAGTIACATANTMIIIPIKAADLGEYSAGLNYSCIQAHHTDPGGIDMVDVDYVFPASGAARKLQIPPTVVGYP